jgi:hypothetical protein
MSAFALAAGVRVEDERPFEDGLQDTRQRVMDHAMTIRRRADQPPLRLIDIRLAIRSRPIGLGRQFAVQAPQFGFQSEVEPGDDQRFEQVIELAVNPLGQGKPVFARETTGVIARPQDQIVGLRDHRQFFVSIHHRSAPVWVVVEQIPFRFRTDGGRRRSEEGIFELGAYPKTSL